MRLVLATRNEGKVRELRQLLRGVDVRLVTLASHPEVPDPDETGDTFQANAEIKASEVARATGLWAMAEDSGLEVDALDGAPGVRSARYSGVHGDDDANTEKLLDALKGVAERGARFACVLALANPQGEIVASTRGVCPGRIAHEPRGSNGFGYDPVFMAEQDDVTLAELLTHEKSDLSHRGHALRAIRPLIRMHLGVGYAG